MTQSKEEETSKRYGELAIKLAKQYAGKIEIIPKVPVRALDDFSVYYTPGVASVSNVIAKSSDRSFELTYRWNTIAIVTDGSRVLGLGNVGPEAAMPVMEGKSLIFKFLGGVDAVPLTLATQDKDQIVETVKRLEPSFGGINLEDIESPKCFEILDRLIGEMNIPVWHDDQQGTAGVTLAALFNALKITGRSISDAKITLIGAGAANIATARLFITAGARPGNIVLTDSKGILHPEREDMDELMLKNPKKYDLAIRTNKERKVGGIAEAMRGADIVVAASKPGPGVIKKEWVRDMAKDAVVFALANPIPEIWPSEALEGGAKIVATGRSDFPNQVNNSLVFPSIFRGALDARARKVTDEMVIAGARELAGYAERKGLTEKYIVPTMSEWDVYPMVAASVASQAVKDKVARAEKDWKEFHKEATRLTERSRRLLSILLKSGIVT